MNLNNMYTKYDNLLKKYELVHKTNSIWSYPKTVTDITENYGWKIHISAIVTNATQIAQKFLEYNEIYDFNFKIVSNLSFLEQLNKGYWGNSQVGKFITIYPKKGYVNQTLESLHYKFHNDIGITVGSDYSYKLNSNIYYRYGTITKDILHIDKRDKKLRPFPDAEKVADFYIEHFQQLPTKYIILKSLRQFGLSGIFLGLDTESKNKVIIRYSTKFFDIDFNMIDGNDRLLNERTILQKLKIYPVFEKLVDIFYINDSVFLVTEFYNGKTLDYIASNEQLDTLSLEIKIGILRKLAHAVHILHNNNIIFRDLSFDNIMLDNNYNVKIIDFEYALSLSSPISYLGRDTTPVGTYGFFDPQNYHVTKEIDFFSLYKCWLYINHPDLYRNTVKIITPNMSYKEVNYILSQQKYRLSDELNDIYYDILQEIF